MKSVTGAEFMEKTKYRYLGESDQAKELPQPPVEKPAEPGKPVIQLPKPKAWPGVATDLTQAIQDRVSVRRYGPKPLTLMELAYLLWCAQGVKSIEARQVTLRNVPSAGARHPLETYVLANNVAGLSPGLYRYIATAHVLTPITTEAGLAEQLARACLNQRMVSQAAAAFFWAADAYRCAWRYGERGYRYMHLDAGHACQNLALAAVAIGGGSCAVGAYDDDAVNRLLGLDGVDDFVVYAAVVGKQP
ncbi:MAG TPA: nitroreductase [Clostridiales bacterium UBA8153]|nr:nitroreductase [Clostridiales bacterium UBA8153]